MESGRGQWLWRGPCVDPDLISAHCRAEDVIKISERKIVLCKSLWTSVVFIIMYSNAFKISDQGVHGRPWPVCAVASNFATGGCVRLVPNFARGYIFAMLQFW